MNDNLNHPSLHYSPTTYTPLNHPVLEAYLAEIYQAEEDLRKVQKTKASFELFCVVLATFIGFLIGMAVQS